jgi:hypothetical protein
MNLKQEDMFSKCEKCNGNGYYLFEDVSSRANKPCDCTGGIILTENGRVLKEFIKQLKCSSLI